MYGYGRDVNRLSNNIERNCVFYLYNYDNFVYVDGGW